MLLETDIQTLEDLRIFGKRDQSGIFEIYNKTRTRGGENLLRDLFRQPSADQKTIADRIAIFRYFSEQKIAFPFDPAMFDLCEKYIRNRSVSTGASSTGLGEKDIQNGVTAIIKFLNGLRSFMDTEIITKAKVYGELRASICSILDDLVFEPVFREHRDGKVAFSAVAAYDLLFRTKIYANIESLLNHMYLLDVYLAVAEIARERKFAFPTVHEKGSKVLRIEGLYHPELERPVTNTVAMEGPMSLTLLTGANMAGKSTFLRSIGTAVYLAHIGFPVAAKSMDFAVMDGIYTTINLPDNLGIGASHFYAEVLRVKKIATELGKGKSLFIIFDELFRGTNVKDAHEATVEVAGGFARKDTSRFIISSHIVEAAEQLSLINGVDFWYLPTKMDGAKPVYTYKLENGVTNDRHGMLIIQNEGILDILKNGKKKLQVQQLKKTI
ncbi:MAG: DNA mismatch repair protein [Sphingobacterium sp.]|jgi:DNA mismatch repair ATPase MutS|nr:DNA mismatch repair protein [Sphingobacterium sp.]